MMKEATTEPLVQKRIVGRISHLNKRGWGVLISEELPFQKIFFHWTNLDKSIDFRTLSKKTKLSFVPVTSERGGYKAIHIKLYGEEVSREV